MMRLGNEETSVRFGQETVTCRPTLRAALVLNAKHGGLDRLAQAIADGSVSAIADVIEATATTPCTFPDLLRSGNLSVQRILAVFTAPCLTILSYMLNPLDEQPEGDGKGKPMSFAEFYGTLFGYACGWLGWSVNQAFEATPLEIITAFRAHTDSLKAIYGSAESDKDKPLAGTGSDFFAALG